MRESVGREFVPLCDDPFDKGGITLRNPPQSEESPGYAGVGKKLQYPVDIAFNAAFPLIPLLSVYNPKECLDLEVILDIDRQGISGVATGGRDRSLCPVRYLVTINLSRTQRICSSRNASGSVLSVSKRHIIIHRHRDPLYE